MSTLEENAMTRLLSRHTMKMLCGLLAFALLWPQAAVGGELRAAAVKVDVTPETPQMLLGYAARRSTGVHDRIHHRIAVLDDGSTTFVLVSSEFCVMSPTQYDAVAKRLKAEQGIDRVNFWWTLTHTHSAPEVGPPGLPEAFMGGRYQHRYDEEYTAFVEQSLLDGVAKARAELKAARLGVGWGFSMANINRRAREVDGRTTLGMNPDGPVDRRIGLIRIDNADGTPLAVIANYAMHGTVLGAENLLISGDGPGVVSTYVEEHVGAPMLYVNGAAGNIAPIYSVYPSPRAGHLSQFQALLGDRILDAYAKTKTERSEVTLRTDEITVETARRPGLKWPEYLGDYTRADAEGNGSVLLPVRFLGIDDDVAIWGAPLELFCEISNDVRDRSPFPFTYYFGYTNGWLGYLLTADEIPYGGYETRVSPFTEAAEADLREAVLSHLHGSMRSAR